MKTNVDMILNTTRTACGATSIQGIVMDGHRLGLRTHTYGSLGTSPRTESCAAPGNTVTPSLAASGMLVFSGARSG